MTMYADDSHLRWVFSTVPEFERAIQELKMTFAVFRRLGMQVNNLKTQAILSPTGPSSIKFKSCICGSKVAVDDSSYHREILRRGSPLWTRPNT